MDLQERSDGRTEVLQGGGAGVGEVPAANDAAAAGERRVRTYEELDGAEGRGVFFRPQRFAAADFAPLRGTVTVGVGGRQLPCALPDVSQSGAAFSWPEDVPIRQGQALRLVLRFDGHEVWRGEARVGSVREQDGTRVVGASFDGGLLDTDQLLQLREVRGWRAAGASPGAAGRRWHARGGHEFKSLVSELRLFLEDVEAELRAFEERLPWHVMQEPSPARAALVTRMRGELAEVVRYAAEIDRALRDSDPAERAALREFSLRQVHRFLMQAPWMHRARHKPFGYPGDYEVMNFVYERDFEGPTLFARALGHAFLQTPAALAVRHRKDLMRRQLRAVLEQQAGQSGPVRFLSIAAGPARELQELLTDYDELPAPLEIVLFDQDKGALAHAFRRLRPVAEDRFPGQVRVTFFHESIKRLLRDLHLFDAFGGFDAVYSCGLFDYLQESTAVRLARNLFAAVKPGGQAFIANMVDHPSRWFMEHHLEWELIYRSREKLVEIGRRAAPEARIRVLEEETGVNPFIELARGS